MFIKCKIDGVYHELRYVGTSGARGHQFQTKGNESSHAFKDMPEQGTVFRTNGHRYEILG